MTAKIYDAIVVGAGHAGIEAGLALARKGHKTLVLTMSLDAVGFMACNPNIGGTAKGHLVKEIDALGGAMGIIADKATIQSKMLNLGNGPAVHSLRNQIDKNKYHKLMKNLLENQSNIDLLEGEAVKILYENNAIAGIKTAIGESFFAKALILTTGVYLKSQIIIGDYVKNSGPSGFQRAEGLTDSLEEMGLPVRRFKTGTPPRINRKTIDFTKMEIQKGDEKIYPFSEDTDFEIRNDMDCYLTYTNLDTHSLILDNLDRSPLYNGTITSAGPRYCPAIEVKIVRFKDKERHQIFIEPEGADTGEMYVQGLSTSMPYDVQEKMLNSVKGLENAKIMRYGYAIEYDCLNPLCLLPTLAVKGYKGLYSAGQINGSSGYEEAAAQGLIAGLNAALYIEGKEQLLIRRDEAYIGVLIDDLVTKGTEEPYRMMTSRAEYRLHLRQDNADLRLTEKGRQTGLVTNERYEKYLEKLKKKEIINEMLTKHYSPSICSEVFKSKNQPEPKSGISGKDILKRIGLDYMDLIKIDSSFAEIDEMLLQQAETEIKYEGYLSKQEQAVKEMRKMENKTLSADFDYDKVEGLRIEAKSRLSEIRPLTLAQASRISGVNPADIVVLMVHLQKHGSGY